MNCGKHDARRGDNALGGWGFLGLMDGEIAWLTPYAGRIAPQRLMAPRGAKLTDIRGAIDPRKRMIQYSRDGSD